MSLQHDDSPDVGRADPDAAEPRGDARGTPAGAGSQDNAQQDDAARDDGPPEGGKARSGRRRYYIIGGAVVLVIAVVAAGLWWLHARHYVSTEDAYIDAHIVQVSAEVAGTVTRVAVSDNAAVAAGDVLATIDDRSYRAAVDQAEADVAQGEANIAELNAEIDAQQAQIDQARKQVSEAKAALDFAQQEHRRYQDLLARGAGTEQAAQRATSTLKQKQAAFDAAQASVTAAVRQQAVLRARKKVAVAKREAAQAALRQARLNLDNTTVRASVAGHVSKISAAAGSYAQPGQALMMLVPNRMWVTANFKETKLTDMHPGQHVEISIDAYPDRSFAGTIDSIQTGSGQAFSLLPAENATGNFVKVVQRVPVKITFDRPPDVPIGPGMSVVPTVKVQ